MDFIFEWDKIKAEHNARKHGVSFDEAQTVFLDCFSVMIPDESHSNIEERFLLIGTSHKHRILVVSYTDRGDIIRVISARKATDTNGDNMKTMTSNNQLSHDDMQPEYDFSGGIRGKYARTLKENGYTIRIYHPDGTFSERLVLGEKTIILDADVWEHFSSSDAVNNALRTLISLVPQKHIQ